MADKYKESMIILPTTRCASRCNFCAYHSDLPNILQERPSLEYLKKETILRANNKGNAIEKNSELYVVNSGSLFNERQIPREYIGWLADFVKDKNVDLVVECRADSKLEMYAAEIEKLVGSTNKLTVAMGLEAYRPDVGDEIFRRLRKGITSEQCTTQSKKLQDYGAETKAYVLIAPPWLEGPSYKKEGYRKNIDWLIETAFMTSQFAVEEMGVKTLGMGPFFPYKGTNETIPEDWVPISATESAEIANQIRQILPEIRMDYSSRQIHFPFGNYFKRRGLTKPIDPKKPNTVIEARENVARICESVFGKRGKISNKISK